MEKALEILHEILDMQDMNYKIVNKLCDVIDLLEEVMKPKMCLTCLCCNKEYQLMSDPPQYELKCGIFKTVFVNDSKQCCSKHTPKDNA